MAASGAKNRTKRTRSIAWRINFGFFFKLLFIFLAVDAVIFWSELAPLLQDLLPVQEAGTEALRYRWAELPGRLANRHLPLLMVEGFFLITTLLFGAGGIRKQLRPLDEIASATQLLGSAGTAIDEQRFHQLEDAIDSISPNAEDAQLRTGDRELAGLEHAVNNLIQRMRDSYRQQARFVSDASHELRTPIAVIQGYANMLDRWGKQDEKVLTESIDAIKAESEHMKRLVEQLLFLARGDSGRTKLELAPCDLSAMLREVFEESEMIDREHRYELRAETAVSTVGDMSMLKQAARILVDNAAKYTPSGGTIILRTQYIQGVAAFTVQDSGIGIPGVDLAHVFERFYRADSSRARETGGTGLGLAIAKWIVEKHGGWFDVLSREEVGTRISVLIPEQPAASGQAAPTAE